MSNDTKDSVVKFVNGLAEQVPSGLKPIVEKAAPIIGDLAVVADKVVPIVEDAYDRCHKVWKQLEPYKPHLLIPSLIGLIMCFFGGSFLTLIAAIEAFRMVGYEMTAVHISSLADDFQKIHDANKKDNEVDDDKDGVADVKQINSKALFHRKVMLFLKTVDPQRVTSACAGLNAGFMAIIATLKMDFAKALTLGCAIGDVFEKPADKYLLPHIEALLPAEYKKWAKPALSSTIKYIAVSIAWMIQRVISAFHSAIRGGLMFSRNILKYLSEMKIVDIKAEETYIDEVGGCAIALIGLMWQLRNGFSLPFPLSFFLFPFSCGESFLLFFIGDVTKGV